MADRLSPQLSKLAARISEPFVKYLQRLDDHTRRIRQRGLVTEACQNNVNIIGVAKHALHEDTNL